jgi:hypothetical protein
MFSMFKPNPTKKLNKLLFAKLEEAMHAQRNGDIKGYAQLSFEADEIEKKISEIEKQTAKNK